MIDFGPISKVLILAGIIITGMGIIFLLMGKIPWLGKLPGDIYIEREDFSFYFPITTCIIVSIVVSAVFFFITKR